MTPSVPRTLIVMAVLALLTSVLTSLASQAQKAENLRIKPEKQLSIVYKPIHTPADIESLTPPHIRPMAYTRVSTLANLDVGTKKQKFFDMILPAILISKQRLKDSRDKLALIAAKPQPDPQELQWLEQQFKRYKAKDINELRDKLVPHPNSIILAQAALETGWGTSRFFLDGNNIFGVWSFNANEPRMRASHTREGKAIYVKKYSSLIEAVDDYFVTIARGGPYRQFRQARLDTSDPLKLIPFLDKYSEIGMAYVQRLRSMIVHNKMQRFDQYQLQTLRAI
ncbi:MAG: glucosaminidase domain-containing protein [Pontibacterium sp.]